jgi:molybdopterin converting factor small subunit
MNMKVAVKLHGILRDYRPQGVKIDLFDLSLSAGAVVQDAVEYFGIPIKAVHAVFLNGEVAETTSALKDGDHVRLFPPVVGGSDRPIRVFIAGIMQGSRRENNLIEQDYRRTIAEFLQQQLTAIEIVDPLALHPNSIEYDNEAARRTLIGLAQEAGRADVVIAFVPEASMGTALEMWEAFHQQRPIFTISPLIHNWVVKCLSTQVFEDLAAFRAFVTSGEFVRQVQNRA